MKENYLLKTKNAERLYREYAADLPLIDFHNHISVYDIHTNRKFESITELWLDPDPYKHRLMRICGVDEYFITGNATPYEKFQKYCDIFPYLAGSPVYDWSRMELSSVFGINERICSSSAKRIFDSTGEMLASSDFSVLGILSKFNIEYQSPVASIEDDLSHFTDSKVAPSLRADSLLSADEKTLRHIEKMSKIKITDEKSYIAALRPVFDKFSEKGCKFADHSLDSEFFDTSDEIKTKRLEALAKEYAQRGWTLLLHLDANRETSKRLENLAGKAGGFAATGGRLDIMKLSGILRNMEMSGLPDTVLFPLNINDQAPLAIFQGSFTQSGVLSKVQLGPAWWWCDHKMGILNTLSSISSFGLLSGFIGMTTDSRSILSFVRHDYFRRILASFLDEENERNDMELSDKDFEILIKRICYENAKSKINGRG